MLGQGGDAVMAAIAARALARNRVRVAELAAILALGLPEDRRDDAHALAHQVAGSAGTFGRDDASVIARRVMEAIAAGASASDAGVDLAALERALED